MHKFKPKAFTLVELVIVTVIVGILMMATTVYLGGSDEKRKIIEAQGCANTIGGEINNFIFYTLTSKNLKIGDETISPTHYIVQLSGSNDDGTAPDCLIGDPCDKLVLSYITETDESSINTYKTLSTANTCRQTRQPLNFYWSGENSIKYVKMNKGLSPKNIHDNNVFYMELDDNDKLLLGDIIATTCLDKNCTNPKEIGKFGIDARSQTISRRNCKFYQNEDPTKCEEREK